MFLLKKQVKKNRFTFFQNMSIEINNHQLITSNLEKILVIETRWFTLKKNIDYRSDEVLMFIESRIGYYNLFIQARSIIDKYKTLNKNFPKDCFFYELDVLKSKENFSFNELIDTFISIYGGYTKQFDVLITRLSNDKFFKENFVGIESLSTYLSELEDMSKKVNKNNVQYSQGSMLNDNFISTSIFFQEARNKLKTNNTKELKNKFSQKIFRIK